MIRLLFFVALLGFGHLAMAKTNEPLEQLFSLEKFRALPATEKTLYIKNLQALLVSLNDEQSPQSTADNHLFQMLMMPAAYADGETVNGNVVGGPCIFAGNISTFASNGLCPRPPQGGCSRGQIQCNALVFGDGVCVQPNGQATKNCMQQAKPAKDIVSYAESHKDEWQDMSKTLDGYCANTGTQGYPCRVIQTRLTEMRRIAESGSTPAQKPDPIGPPAPKAPKTPPPAPPPPELIGPPAPPAAGIPKFRKPRKEVGGPGEMQGPPAPAPAEKDPKPKPAPEVVKKDESIEGAPAAACDLERLMEPVTCKMKDDCSSKNGDCKSRIYLRALMVYDEAYNVFCDKRSFDKDLDDKVRKNFRDATKCLDDAASVLPDQRDKVNAKRLNGIVKNEIMPNYERCLKDLKDKKLPPVKNAGTMLLETKPGLDNLYATAKPTSGKNQDYGNMYMMTFKMKSLKTGLCDFKPQRQASKEAPPAEMKKGSQ